MSRFTSVVLLITAVLFATVVPKANVVPVAPPVSSYDVSARNIVRLIGTCSGNQVCSTTLASENANPYTVPQGKRLVIMGYSASMIVTTGSINNYLTIANGNYFSVITPGLHKNVTNPTSFDTYVANGTAVDLYIDQGDSIQLTVSADNFIPTASIHAWGYLVDCTGGVCTKG